MKRQSYATSIASVGLAGFLLSATILGWSSEASATSRMPLLTPDQAMLACHAHALGKLNSGETAVTAIRRYHAVKTDEGLFRVIGHFSDDTDGSTIQFDVECLIAPGEGVVTFEMASKPALIDQRDLALALSRLAKAPGPFVDPGLDRLSFQQAFHVVDMLSRQEIQTLHELIHEGAISLPTNMQAAIEARSPTTIHGRKEER